MSSNRRARQQIRVLDGSSSGPATQSKGKRKRRDQDSSGSDSRNVTSPYRENMFVLPTEETCHFCAGLNPEKFVGPKVCSEEQHQSKCGGCNLLWNVLFVNSERSHLGYGTPRQLNSISHNGTGGLLVDWEVPTLSGEKHQTTLYLDGWPWRDFVSIEAESGWTWDERRILWRNVSLTWAGKSIHNCLETHPACRRRPQSLPTRVLDLGDPDHVGLQDNLRLYETRGHVAAYACLSHRWGSARHIITTRENLERHKQVITFTDLPRTFRDAIEIARYLKFRYLWIDSLCIIQDDKDDWRREAASMARVFHYTALCIAATSGTSDSGGLQGAFRPGDLLGSLQFGNKATKVCIRRQNLWHILNVTQNHYPLLRRGWVFQERLLAPRIVHFCNDEELVFECTQCVRSEYGYYATSTGMGPKIDHTYSLSVSTPNELAFRWRNIVQEYTKLDLTIDDDVLPAISGLARQMERYRKDQYFAGLWKNSFVRDLMWKISTSELRARTWRAPTWSWASVKGFSTLNFFSAMSMTEQSQLLNCECIPTGEDPFGELSSARADAFGVLAQIDGNPWRSRQMSISWPFHCRLESYTERRSFYADSLGVIYLGIIYLDSSDDDNTQTEGFFYFHLSTCTSPQNTWKRFVGLALRKKFDATYERIGLVEIPNNNGMAERLDEALSSKTTITLI